MYIHSVSESREELIYRAAFAVIALDRLSVGNLQMHNSVTVCEVIILQGALERYAGVHILKAFYVKELCRL